MKQQILTNTRFKTAVLAIMTLVLLGLASWTQAAITGITRVSVDAVGGQADNHTTESAISADGQYVMLASGASNLVPGDTNATGDIFAKDLDTGAIERISVSTAGVEANGHSFFPEASADGRYVAFNSVAWNLVPGDTNNKIDLFYHDRLTGSTTRISTDSSGGQANEGVLGKPILSADGRYVVFSSLADLDGNISNREVFIKDTLTGSTTLVSANASGVESNDDSHYPDMSADGRYVVYASEANNLVVGDTNADWDIFLRDMQTGSTSLVSTNASGVQTSATQDKPSISADGRYVAFRSVSTNMVPGDTNGSIDIFVKDLQTGAVDVVSSSATGTLGNGHAWAPELSADGRYVVFYSVATNLVPGGTSGTEVFIKDRQTGRIELLSKDSAGVEGNSSSVDPEISDDGSVVFFRSQASNLVPSDTNNKVDGFATINPLLSEPNQAPVLNPIGNQVVPEGYLLGFTVIATDPDTGDQLTLVASNTPAGSTFNPSSGVFNWLTDHDDAGLYENIVFGVYDDGDPVLSDFEVISIEVLEMNRPPVLVVPGAQSVDAGQSLSFDVTASDPDGDEVTITASGLPAGASFASGTLSWTTTPGDVGVYTVDFVATDNASSSASSSASVEITVLDVSQTPKQLIDALILTVKDADLPRWVKKLYVFKLKHIKKMIVQGKERKAIKKLRHFIRAVKRHHAWGMMDRATRNDLVQQAKAIIAALR